MSDEFDFEKFYELLYTASKNAFTSVQHEHKDENFYVYALFTCGDLVYITPSSSTEEGLTLVAQKYKYTNKRQKYYQDFSIDQLREKLRWSPCDSPLQTEGEEYFTEVNELVSKAPAILDAISIDDSWDEFHDFVDTFLGVCVKVLQQLDREGIFGEGEKRNSVILNILMGDQTDEERMKFAEILNPSSVYNRFRQVYHA